MKKISVIVLLLVLLDFACPAQRLYSNQNLEQASADSLNSYLGRAQKLKKTGAIMSIAGSSSFVAGMILGAIVATNGGTDSQWELGGGLILIGAGVTLIGIPILITGSSRVKKVNSAINTRMGASLNFTPSIVYNNKSQILSSGIALQIRF